ncbi:MAG: AtpZ/AtpI family protein [Patescibacteria group bacterium]
MQNQERQYLLFGLKIVGDFGATIAVPVVLFVLIGQWLDGRYGTNPFCTIGAFILAALVSGRSIYRKAKQYGKAYMEIEKKL